MQYETCNGVAIKALLRDTAQTLYKLKKTKQETRKEYLNETRITTFWRDREEYLAFLTTVLKKQPNWCN